jgi:hypothetical protein
LLAGICDIHDFFWFARLGGAKFSWGIRDGRIFTVYVVLQAVI